MGLRLHYNAPVVLSFAIGCTLVFCLNYLTANFFYPIFSLSAHFNFSTLSSYLSMFLYVFGHANLDHLLQNMMFLLLLGPIMEEKYGSRGVLLMILVTAFVTAILNMMFFNTGILGASGIVFMFIILVSFANVQKGTIPVTFILVLFLYVGREIINSLNADNISQFAHILGGICGSFFGFFNTNNKKLQTQ
jgi:membrane associated rhomboid family serine protease